MSNQRRLIDQVRVAAPCPANWGDMEGDDQVRDCSLCRHKVYNLSAMTSAEAEQLLAGRQGRLCVGYFMRQDGKVMTKDCAKGVRSLRQRAMRRVALAASLILTVFGCGEQNEKIKQAYGLDKFEKEDPQMVVSFKVGQAQIPTAVASATKEEQSIPTKPIERKK